MSTTLTVRGKLRGVGCEVRCLLMATRSECADAENAIFTRCAILEAPLWLSDGYYEAVFCGQSAFLQRRNGIWSVGVPWRQRGPAAAEPAENPGVMSEVRSGAWKP